ncbi:TetR/AcrR family transcriptional regulator [Actinopolymorpha sp. B11F2]|uniref:TetR/AcrR family transcriptional regulator n=1 Tax=Actinopolymorpha sp. B11F2 TaxID=3160862 RepID=UPI0032E36B23
MQSGSRPSGTRREPRTPAGRPRDTQIDAAVLRTTRTLLQDSGYTSLTLEEVARRAGTTKPAIYRRWPTRQHLVTAALAMGFEEVRAPDTGCTLCDLNEGINVFVAAFRQIRPHVLGPLLAECASKPELRQALLTTLFEPPRHAVFQMLDKAVARGDLRDDLDTGLVVDMLGSLVHYRALFGHAPIGEADVERAVESLLRGIATDYPALVEHSRRLAGTPRTHAAHQ